FLGRSVTKTTHVSEATMQKVDHEIRSIIDTQYAVARSLIESNQDKMHAMAKALLEWETIDAEQINDIMEGRPPRAPQPPPSSSDTGSMPPPSSGQAAASGEQGPATTPV
ncbi:MAG TPA: cell division protein FtsH, partial [Castellaniella sp.]|nr:cell division protein FtsH [Castellaniella sp.]